MEEKRRNIFHRDEIFLHLFRVWRRIIRYTPVNTSTTLSIASVLLLTWLQAYQSMLHFPTLASDIKNLWYSRRGNGKWQFHYLFENGNPSEGASSVTLPSPVSCCGGCFCWQFHSSCLLHRWLWTHLSCHNWTLSHDYREDQPSTMSRAWKYLYRLTTGVCIFTCVKTFGYSVVVCCGNSMEPTIFDGGEKQLTERDCRLLAIIIMSSELIFFLIIEVTFPL